ncbi:MAG: hypothetical protein JWL77_624 [Chthonomonadaceae bacterium]|nr:hypothetical protein [Chthonomonadaceae bacterium]
MTRLLRTCLVSELRLEIVAMTPALLNAEFDFKELPQKAASSIQKQFYVPHQELLTDQIIEINPGHNPEAIAVARGEVRFCLENLPLQQRYIARLLADGHERDEIAQILNVEAENVKYQVRQIRKNSLQLCAA